MLSLAAAFLALPHGSTVPLGEESLFNFRTLSGWKVDGEVVAPAAPGLARQVGGEHGSTFASTYSRSNADIGTATSPPFVLSRPFLNFRVAGGNQRERLCLRLIVDGKAVRSASGDDTLVFKARTWDVSLFLGKSAQIQIVDQSKTAQWGFLLVDGMTASNEPQDRRILDVEDGPSLREFGFASTPFLDRATVTFSPRYPGDLTPLFDFGVPPSVLKELIDACSVSAYRRRHDPSRTVAETARLLREDVAGQLASKGIIRPSKLLADWLTAEQVCAYVIANVRFDDEGMKTDEAATRARQETPFRLFAAARPVAICPGFCKIATELAFAAGLSCCTVNGVCRWGSQEVVQNDGHSWVVFDFGNNVRVPADVTPMRPIDARSERVVSKIAWHCLPVTRRSWELVARMHWPSKVRWTPEGTFRNGGVQQYADVGQHNPNLDIRLFDHDWNQWAAVNAKPYWDLEAWYMARTYSRFPGKPN